MPAAAGELPVPGHAIAAVGDDRLGAGRGRAGRDRRARVAEHFTRHLRVEIGGRHRHAGVLAQAPGDAGVGLAIASITWKKVAGSTSSPPMLARDQHAEQPRRRASPRARRRESRRSFSIRPAAAAIIGTRPRAALDQLGAAPRLVGGACCGRYAVQHFLRFRSLRSQHSRCRGRLSPGRISAHSIAHQNRSLEWLNSLPPSASPIRPTIPRSIRRTGRRTRRALFREVKAQLDAAKADAIIVIANDHFNTFFMNNFPTFAIGRDRRGLRAQRPDQDAALRFRGAGGARLAHAQDRDGGGLRFLGDAGIRRRPRHAGAAALPHRRREDAGGADLGQHVLGAAADREALLRARQDDAGRDQEPAAEDARRR